MKGDVKLSIRESKNHVLHLGKMAGEACFGQENILQIIFPKEKRIEYIAECRSDTCKVLSISMNV